MPAPGNTGYSLLEILVAMAIFSIATVALTSSIALGVRTNHASERLTHATILALYLGLTPDEWRAIPLPAVAVADPTRRQLLSPFAGRDDLAGGTDG